MTSHTETLVAPTLINIAARGRPGDARFHDAVRAEAVVANDTVAPPLWRGAASRAEVAAAVATQDIAAGGQVHNVQRQEFATISAVTDVATSANQPPSWGSSSGTVFNLKQGETLSLVNALRFTDPDGDQLIVTHIAGTLPSGTTYNSATGLITADEDAALGLHTEDLIFQADDGQQTVKNVGPGKQYATIRAAVLAAQDGDTIQIDPGDYIGDVSTLTANNVLIKGTSTTNRARLFANGVHQSDKGIIVLEGNDCTFENMEFHDAAGPSGNIAGVRHDGAGLTTFRNCGFYDGQNGILSGGGGTVLMELCEFARNGAGDGLTHNVYFHTHQLVTARDCYFHEAKIGHEFKSRAKENVLERCYFVNGSTGTASYEVNVDNGGKLVMRGCMLHKGPNADNQNMIFHNVNSWGSSFNSITLEHCTLVHAEPTGSFINLASGSTTVTLTACLFASNGRPLVSGATPVQNSNFHTTVATILGASNTTDPDFWPDASIHPDLSLPSAVVPTYLIDEPNIFTPRTLASPPKVIGAIQNALVLIGNFFDFPTQLDEQNTYDNVLNWIWTSGDKTTNFATTPPGNLRHSNVHNDSEADDLWNHYVQWKRTKDSNPTAAAKHLAWAQKWRDYFVLTTDYTDNMTATCTTYGDHIYGQGLVLWGIEQNDPAARDRAIELITSIESSSLACIPGTTNMSAVESRRRARALILACYVTMMDTNQRWVTMRDHLIDCWVQSSGWHDTTHPTWPTQVGGNHFASSMNAAGWTATQYNQGLRWNHSFHYGLHTEALWLAYKLTNRLDVRNMLIAMARFVLHYAWDPLHVNPMCSGRWGYRPLTGVGAAPAGMGSPGFLHDHEDEFLTGTLQGVPQVPYPPLWSDPNSSSASNYEISLVNGLVYAYKLTGEVPFLDRAKAHLRQATCYAGATGTGLPKLPQNEVRKYLDTEVQADPIYFNFNRGELQYSYMIFENGGNPSVIP